MSEQATTIGSAATLIGCALQDYDIDAGQIFREAGLSPASMNSPDLRYPVTRMQHMWRLAVERTGDPCFGLTVAGHMQPQVFHGLGFVWMSSDTLFDALRRLIKYQRLISTVADFSLDESTNPVALVIDTCKDCSAIEPAVIDAATGVFVRMCRLAMCRPFNPVRLLLKRPQPACFDRFREFFQSPVEFGADRNVLYLDPDQLIETLPGANPELERANDQVVIDYLGRFDQENLSMQVRSRLIELLPGGQPTQKEVASSLNLSVRNLQRKLQREGISFKQLLDETRKDLAAQYIRENHRRIGEITYLLGFSEPSNFTRAFRRWTGVSPNEFRRR